MSKTSEPPVEKYLNHWKPGESGNPAGKPKGSRTKLRDQFYEDILTDWQEGGREAIQRFRNERPHDYVKVVASVLPKEVNVKVNELEELSDAQLGAQLNALVREMRSAGLDPLAGDEAPLGLEQARPLPPLQ